MKETKLRLVSVLVRYFIILSIAGAALGLIIYSFFTYQSIKNFAFENLVSARDRQVLLIDGWFHEQTQDIKQLSISPAIKNKDINGMRELFASYLQKMDTDFESFAFVDRNGKVLLYGTDDHPGVKVPDRSYFQAAMEGKDYISEVVISRLTGQPTVVISSPVYSDTENLIGVIFGSVSLERINQITSSLRFGKTGETYLVDKNGLMMTESRFTQWLIDHGIINTTTKNDFRVKTTAVDKVIQGQTGYGEYTGYRGYPVLGAYQWLPDYSWGLVVEEENNEIMGSIPRKIIIISLAFALFIALVIYPLSSYIAAKIVLPLTKIAQKVKLFTEDYKSMPLSDSAVVNFQYEEVDVLYKSFFNMSKEIGELMHSLEAQALYDPLTGLANRRFFFQRGGEIIQLALRTNTVCSLIYFDIDKFKQVNDTYGHNYGDQVLVQLANIVKKVIRINDLPSRLGGEEFVIISPDTDLTGASQLAERLRHTVEGTPIEMENTRFNITISIGVSVFNGTEKGASDLEILERLIRESDTAMYFAKENGRNRVEIFGET